MKNNNLESIVKEDGKGFLNKVMETGRKFLYATTLAIALSGSANAGCGDCNGDGRQDILDALVAAQSGVGLVVLQSPEYEACNVEGVPGGPYTPGTSVDVIDALEHAQVAAGIVPPSNCILDQEILFSSDRDGNREVYKMKQDGSAQTRLTNDTSADYDASWSPTGEQMVFVSERGGGQPQLYIADADGNNPMLLTTFGNYNHGHPKWSPDGTKILFESSREGNFEIYVMDATPGSVAANITTNTYADFHGDWSPDGSEIVFVSKRSDNQGDIWKMTNTGATPTRLTFHPLEAEFLPHWSPDGSSIAYTREWGNWLAGYNNEITTIQPSGAGETRLTYTVDNPRGNDQAAGWTRDGSMIILQTYRTLDWEVGKMPLIPSGQVTLLTNNPAHDYVKKEQPR